jgi:hypothetical protein
MVLDLKEDVYLFYILNLSLENTILLRGMRMDNMKVSKCLPVMLIIKERHKVTHLCT